jgi:hypothetical protein
VGTLFSIDAHKKVGYKDFIPPKRVNENKNNMVKTKQYITTTRPTNNKISK